MQKLKVWAAYEGVSEMSNRLLGHFLKAEDATKAAKGKGWWGGNGSVKQETIVIYSDYADYEAIRKADARKSALDKLTQEEKEALGLR